MKNNYLAYLKENLGRSPSFSSAQVISLNDSGKWIVFDSGESADGELAAVLKGAKHSDRPIRIKGLKHRVGFPVAAAETVVVVDLPPRTKAPTIEKLRNRVEECANSATRSVQAHYDELTNVFNRHGIKNALNAAYRSTVRREKSSGSSQQQVSANTDFVLFSFDIDRFKSINDTYGHEVGDQVLAAFASRLDRATVILQKQYASACIFGRPGGEEFELLLIGAFAYEERRKIGEGLLEVIRQPLSLQAAGHNEPKGPKAKSLDPSKVPSQVTASIGTSWAKVTSETDITALHAELRKQADSALYRAKSDGRNRLRAYEDILSKHGRVLEYHQHSRLVQLDLGTNVGAEIGQVFRVYFPPYIGGEKMQDEQGQRVFGLYPAVHSASVCIMDVQKEVSTAYVADDSVVAVEVPKGSLLRRVHLGSSTIFPSRKTDGASIDRALGDLGPYIDSLMQSENLHAVVALGGGFRKGDGRPVQTRYDEFSTLLRLLLPSGSSIFNSPGCPVFAVIPNSPQTQATDLETLFENVRTTMERAGLKFSAGVCTATAPPTHVARSGEALCFYAMATLLSGQHGDPNRFFSEDVISEVIYRWRDENKSGDAIVDYQRFREYGFDSPLLENQIGLAIIESEAADYYWLAEAAFTKAADAEPEQHIYLANLGLLQTVRGDYLRAYDTFKRVEHYISEERGTYFLAFARCAMGLRDTGRALAEAELADILLQADQTAGEPPPAPYDRWWHEIKGELKSGRYG